MLFSWCHNICQGTEYKQEAVSGYWRSESMLLLNLVTPRDIAYRTVQCLASLGTVQFVEDHNDHNPLPPPHLRPYTPTIRLCEDLERRLRYFINQMSLTDITPVPLGAFIANVCGRESSEISLNNNTDSNATAIQATTRSTSDFSESREDTTRTPLEVCSLRESYTTHITEHCTLSALEESTSKDESELRALVTTVGKLEEELSCMQDEAAVARTLSRLTRGVSAGLKGIAGVISPVDKVLLERIIYRLSRGNVLLNIYEVEPVAVSSGSINEKAFDFNNIDKDVVKEVFTAFTTSEVLLNRMQRMITTVPSAHVINMTHIADANGPEKFLAEIEKRANEVAFILSESYHQRDGILKRIAQTYNRDKWFIAREKMIHTALNILSQQTAFVQGLIWVSEREKPELDRAVEAEFGHIGDPSMRPLISISDLTLSPGGGDHDASASHNSSALKIPTYFRSNEFIEVFQNIVDAYGVPRYKEVNPAVLTIVTFPYLFGIMFGDIGHGFLLLLFSAFLCIFQKRLEKVARSSEMFNMVFSGRYLLLAMGFFGIYCGVLYNDFFGMSVGIFKSQYSWPLVPPKGPSGIVRPNFPSGHPSVKPDNVYVLGIDVAWAETENKLEFYNSVKMKAAVVVGVVQMLVGLILGTFNHIHNKDYESVIFVSIPEIIFLCCTFGYMALLIIIKWLTVWDNTNDAPSLLETMSSFFLSPGSVKQPLYKGQDTVQTLLLLVAFAQVPVMLLAIPCIKKYRANKRNRSNNSISQSILMPLTKGLGSRWRHSPQVTDDYIDPTSVIDLSEIGSHHDINDPNSLSTAHFDFSEVMIHYIIHTIEFVLGTVSNTASYLRLWALSLAHAQLSEVFLDFAFCMFVGMDKGSGVLVALGTAVWLAATIGVIMMMETLSAFLHSLRLHWVEFQNKFYAADGVAFIPLVLPHPDYDSSYSM